MIDQHRPTADQHMRGVKEEILSHQVYYNFLLHNLCASNVVFSFNIQNFSCNIFFHRYIDYKKIYQMTSLFSGGILMRYPHRWRN